MAESVLDIINYCCAPLDSCLQFSVIYQKKEEFSLFHIIIKYNTGKKLISHNMHSNTKNCITLLFAKSTLLYKEDNSQ